MTDIVDTLTRSRMMSGIRSGNTKPEKLVRTALHSKGFRYHLHDHRMPGCPDLVFPKYHAVLFVHGCFWHGHDCPLFRLPGTRIEFWGKKIHRNRERDAEVLEELGKQGWRTGVVWECALKGKNRIGIDETVRRIISWLESGSVQQEIRGAA